MKIYAVATALVYHGPTLAVQLEYCLSQELYYIFNFFSAVSVSSVVGATFVSGVFPFGI